MHVRVGINGFGRIGRGFVRSVIERDAPVEIVAVNDPNPGESLAHLLEFDTVHGRLATSVDHIGGALALAGRRIELVGTRDPSAIPWDDFGVDVVIESTGRFTGRDTAAVHLESGAERVLISAPSPDADLTVCMGVNHDDFEPESHRVISNASCTTNCLAPMVKVLHEAFGLRSGFVTTAHAFTNDQNLLDLGHRDLRRGRCATQNITPSTTGAARSIGSVFPDAVGRLDGLAMRVPVPDGSITDLVCSLERHPERDELNAVFELAAATSLAGILEYTDRPYVSSDIVGNPHSCVFSARDTMVGPDMVKVLGWYDNEWGYANRLVDLAVHVGAPTAALVA